jgi:cobalt-zinc-cadmium efflux system membrane fusion protein
MKNTLYTKFAMSVIAVAAIILVVSTAWSEEAEHEEGEVSLVLDSAERQAAGIRIGTVQRKEVFQRQRVPGEVVPNAYKSAKVAPRITAQVVRRKVRLGEHVEKGQALVTVSSVEMADAQGELLVADQEWQRVKSLGKEVVSGSRYTEAQVNRQRAMAKVVAFGMS